MLNLKFKTYREIINNTDILEAEERFVLQRQLDNHIKLQSKELISKFHDIYKEFEEVIEGNIEIVKKTPTISKEQAQNNWRDFMSRMGGASKRGRRDIAE